MTDCQQKLVRKNVVFYTFTDEFCRYFTLFAAENLQAKSLRAFHAKYGPALSVRTSLSPYREQEWMVNVPLYDVGAWFAGRRRAATA